MSDIRKHMTAVNKLFESFNPESSVDYSDPSVISAIKSRALLIQLDEMGKKDISLLVESGVNFANDVIRGTVNLRNYIDTISESDEDEKLPSPPDEIDINGDTPKNTYYNKDKVEEADEDNLDGLDTLDDDLDVENEIGNMDRFHDDPNFRSANMELPPAGEHGASAENDEHALLFDIEDYQDRGLSAAHKHFDVRKLQNMPYAFIKKIHELVLGSSEDDGAEQDEENTSSGSTFADNDPDNMQAHVSADESVMPEAAPQAMDDASDEPPSREEMIKDIGEYQELGVSASPKKYDMSKLMNAPAYVLLQIYDAVTKKDNKEPEIEFSGQREEMPENVSPAARIAMQKMREMTEPQRRQYIKSIKNPALRESICFVPMQRINPPVVVEDEDELEYIRRMAGLIK